MAEIEPITSTYFHNKGIKLGLPISGSFEITRKCNFNCKMCYVHSHDTSKDKNLSAEEWLKIAADAKEMGMLFLLITGGEPTVRPDFPHLYKELSKMGFVISINTNGSLINDEIMHLFKDYPPNRVNISLYGGSEDTYEKLCENSKFAVVTENIKKLKENGVNVRINAAFNRFNSEDIEDVVKFTKENNIILKPTSYMYPSVRVNGETGENDARLAPAEAAKINLKYRLLMSDADNMHDKAVDIMKFEPPDCGEADVEADGVRCRAGRSSFWVTYDGKLMPCGMMVEPVISLKENSFADAWNYIREKTAQIRLPVECATCKNKKICNVCAAMCYAETGSFSGKPKYVCSMIDSICEEYKNYL